jgi:hypothetical protein
VGWHNRGTPLWFSKSAFENPLIRIVAKMGLSELKKAGSFFHPKYKRSDTWDVSSYHAPPLPLADVLKHHIVHAQPKARETKQQLQ